MTFFSLRRPLVAFAVSIALLAGCAKPETQIAVAKAASPSIQEIATQFQTYPQMTRKPARVSAQITTLCMRSDPKQFMGTQGPHAVSAIYVFMNDSAAQAFARGGRAYPVGAVVVKQKLPSFSYDLSSRTGPPKPMAGVGGMVKRPPGYDPTHGDWEYFYFDDPADIASGRLSSCVDCHQTTKRTDYVFGTWMAH